MEWQFPWRKNMYKEQTHIFSSVSGWWKSCDYVKNALNTDRRMTVIDIANVCYICGATANIILTEDCSWKVDEMTCEMWTVHRAILWEGVKLGTALKHQYCSDVTWQRRYCAVDLIYIVFYVLLFRKYKSRYITRHEIYFNSSTCL